LSESLKNELVNAKVNTKLASSYGMNISGAHKKRVQNVIRSIANESRSNSNSHPKVQKHLFNGELNSVGILTNNPS